MIPKSTKPSFILLKLNFYLLIFFASIFNGFSQGLSIEKIMQDQAKWMGTAPSNPFWSEDSKTIYFSWNPDKNKGDSLYKIVLPNKTPIKVSPLERRKLPSQTGVYTKNYSLKVYEKNGDLFLINTNTLDIRQITNTIDAESNPNFNFDESKIIYTKAGNLYSFGLANGFIAQLTNFISGKKKEETKPANEQEKWLKADQLALFEVLNERKAKKDSTEKINKANLPKRPKEIYLDENTVENVQISPDLQFVSYRLSNQPKNAKKTNVPNYVTETGFTEELPSRTKVGAPLTSYESFIYDTKRDSVYPIITKDIIGINERPIFETEKLKKDTVKTKNVPRKVIVSGLNWSENGKLAFVVVRSADNKDRWIMLADPKNGSLKNLDRQHDEAWVAGPGIGNFFGGVGNIGWLDNETIYYQSEATGFSHLYSQNVLSGEKKQLTSGNFEVFQAQLSRDKKKFYLTTNEQHPGEQHAYILQVSNLEKLKITDKIGANDITISPAETKFINRYSYSNKPWELYLDDFDPKTEAQQITQSLTDEFKSYAWKEPKIISFLARDGQRIYARIYEPTAKLKNKKAVIFVHGAGYLQNAHKWWSNYSREYMFHNLLADKGYTVLDIDYRASAGYGREVRTGIYRYMGGKDITDNLDGAKLLTEKYGINPKKIGIYGGSYGGFITLMAMFTAPDVFAAGAALRPVTDWAAYNHSYTANILNEPQTDSLAYRKSSPIYHANGLKGHLLICHGMVDVNVHIQDSYRLVQRLIELKKENWEMASYPMEDHGFVEPTSWMDEYKRILKLFEERLR